MANRSDEAHTTICQFCHSNANSLAILLPIVSVFIVMQKKWIIFSDFGTVECHYFHFVVALHSPSFDSHCRCTLRIPTCISMHCFSAKKVLSVKFRENPALSSDRWVETIWRPSQGSQRFKRFREWSLWTGNYAKRATAAAAEDNTKIWCFLVNTSRMVSCLVVTTATSFAYEHEFSSMCCSPWDEKSNFKRHDTATCCFASEQFANLLVLFCFEKSIANSLNLMLHWAELGDEHHWEFMEKLIMSRN